MRISIIIPAFNEEKLLGKTLTFVQAAAVAFTRRGWEMELIVCDNNSTDRTAEIARAAGATVVFEPINQIAGARNRGASVATGDWLLFVDGDTQPDAELFADAADAMATGHCLAGGATLKLEPGRHPWLGSLFILFGNVISRFQSFHPGPFIFCEAAAFRQVGGFSTQLFAMEDFCFSEDLRKLARANGKKNVVLRRHPIVVSARKTHLYTPWEHIRYLLRSTFARRKTLTDPKACNLWYDGRR